MDKPKTHLPALKMPAFADARAILVRPNDARCASFWNEGEAGSEQDHDGPTHLIVGRFSSDVALGRMAARWSLNIEDLQAFRDAAEDEICHG